MHLLPSFDDFSTTYAKRAPQLVYSVIPADLLTPVAALLKVRHISPYHFLLESVEGGKVRGRHSIIGLDPDFVWKCEAGIPSYAYAPHLEEWVIDPIPAFTSLRAHLATSKLSIPSHLPPMVSGLFGFMGYDMVRLMEDIPSPTHHNDPLHIPDSVFLRPRILMVFDAVKDEVTLTTPVFPKPGENAHDAYQAAITRLTAIQTALASPLPLKAQTDNTEEIPPLTSHVTYDDYANRVEKAKEFIRAGDIFQVVPSRRLSSAFPLDPLTFYRALRHLNPSPYLFYMALNGFVLTGSSPEIMVRLKDNTVTIRPIAGTRPRGATKAEDLALATDLLQDPKEISEHLMLLDLGRNDVGRVAEPGTVRVTEQMVIEYYSHVMHIVSNVEGTLRKGLDALDALIAGFPAGTVSGAPKIRAMEIIDMLEQEKRSFYGGCVGYISSQGDMDMCIALRTALIKDGMLYAQAGGGVVADSTPEGEFNETTNKSAALGKAAQGAKKFI